LSELVYASLAVFCGAAIQACTGFGFALVVMPCLLLFLPQDTAKPIHYALACVSTTLIAVEARHHMRPRLIVPLSLGGLAGLPLGFFASAALEGPAFKVGAGVLIMAFAVLLLSGWTHPVKHGPIILAAVGLACGFLGGSIAIAGPPVVLFLASQSMPKNIFRSNLVTYFFLLNCYAVAISFSTGLYTVEVLRYAAVLLPLLLLGCYAGIRIAPRVPEGPFRKLTMIVVLIMGAVLIAANWTALF